jgi:hypothetical protein
MLTEGREQHKGNMTQHTTTEHVSVPVAELTTVESLKEVRRQSLSFYRTLWRYQHFASHDLSWQPLCNSVLYEAVSLFHGRLTASSIVNGRLNFALKQRCSLIESSTVYFYLTLKYPTWWLNRRSFWLAFVRCSVRISAGTSRTLRNFAVFHSLTRKTPRLYLKLCHDTFFPHHFRSMIHYHYIVSHYSPLELSQRTQAIPILSEHSSVTPTNSYTDGLENIHRFKKKLHRHLWADCLDNVGSLTSHNPIGLHGLLRG